MDSYQNFSYHNTSMLFPTEQTQAAFLDLNLLYSRQTKTDKLRMVFGIGMNQKGFFETDTMSNGAGYGFPIKFKNTYFSFYGGVSYDLLKLGAIKITAGELLNPEI